jgi:hypothetical protein
LRSLLDLLRRLLHGFYRLLEGADLAL